MTDAQFYAQTTDQPEFIGVQEMSREDKEKDECFIALCKLHELSGPVTAKESLIRFILARFPAGRASETTSSATSALPKLTSQDDFMTECFHYLNESHTTADQRAAHEALTWAKQFFPTQEEIDACSHQEKKPETQSE